MKTTAEELDFVVEIHIVHVLRVKAGDEIEAETVALQKFPKMGNSEQVRCRDRISGVRVLGDDGLDTGLHKLSPDQIVEAMK